MARAKARTRRGWGHLRKLPSGRFQAKYVGPDGVEVKAPSTFATKIDAEGWLADERRRIDNGTWISPEEEERQQQANSTTVSDYFTYWLPREGRRRGTQRTYQSIFDTRVKEYLGDKPLSQVSAKDVREWVEAMRQDFPTPPRNAQTYRTMATMFKSAVAEELIPASPFVVEGVRSPKPKHKTPLTNEELTAIIQALPEVYQVPIALADHCQLRVSEWTELRRKDLMFRKDGTLVIKVSRILTWIDGEPVVGEPKTEAGKRQINVAKALVPLLQAHMDKFSDKGEDALVFPDEQQSWISHNSLYGTLTRTSNRVIGRSVSSHDFRHHGATEFARSGATVKDLMARLGHTTPTMAMRYQHASQERDSKLAESMPIPWTPEKANGKERTQ